MSFAIILICKSSVKSGLTIDRFMVSQIEENYSKTLLNSFELIQHTSLHSEFGFRCLFLFSNLKKMLARRKFNEDNTYLYITMRPLRLSSLLKQTTNISIVMLREVAGGSIDYIYRVSPKRRSNELVANIIPDISF